MVGAREMIEGARLTSNVYLACFEGGAQIDNDAVECHALVGVGVVSITDIGLEKKRDEPAIYVQ